MIPPHALRHAVVFRALMLGDLLCATPALRALRLGLPNAHVVLCGLPAAAALASRLDSVDEFIEFPGHPALQERVAPQATLDAFVEEMRARRFDLALQMHGSGELTTPLVRAFGALSTVAFVREPAATPSTPAPGPQDLDVPWPQAGHEIERCLRLTDALGLPRDGLHLEFPLRPADHRRAAALLAAAGVRGPHVVVHPGSQLPSRRWPIDRFAAVADALSLRGLSVVVTGTAAESPLAAALAAAARRPVTDLTGRTDLWTLGALVASARLVVCNDTGVSHVAAATGTPSVVVACGSDVPRWAPLDRRLHPVRWHAVPCRPCGHATCPIGHDCATAVPAAAVIETALDLLATTAAARPDPTPCPTPLTTTSPPAVPPGIPASAAPTTRSGACAS